MITNGHGVSTSIKINLNGMGGGSTSNEKTFNGTEEENGSMLGKRQKRGCRQKLHEQEELVIEGESEKKELLEEEVKQIHKSPVVEVVEKLPAVESRYPKRIRH